MNNKPSLSDLPKIRRESKLPGKPSTSVKPEFYFSYCLLSVSLLFGSITYESPQQDVFVRISSPSGSSYTLGLTSSRTTLPLGFLSRGLSCYLLYYPSFHSDYVKSWNFKMGIVLDRNIKLMCTIPSRDPPFLKTMKKIRFNKETGEKGMSKVYFNFKIGPLLIEFIFRDLLLVISNLSYSPSLF